MPHLTHKLTPRHMLHTAESWDTHITQATKCRELCAQIVRRYKDPAETTDAKMVLVERGLGAERADAKSQLVKMMVGWVCVGRCIGCARARVRRNAPSRASSKHGARSCTICESGNRTEPRPGVEPGDPQHKAEGWTRCPREKIYGRTQQGC